jgi:SAM-dependent methyltransferase
VNSEPQSREATFDALFASEDDPWGFESSAYERDKRAVTMAALGEGRIGSAFEPGCANGVLTAQLAPRCDLLLAMDVSTGALNRARARLGPSGNVRFRHGNIPGDWPDQAFDLILLSEILYFLSPAEILQTSRKALASLEPGGICLLVNWTGPTDLPVDGNRAVQLFEEACDWHCGLSIQSKTYRVDRYRSGVAI